MRDANYVLPDTAPQSVSTLLEFREVHRHEWAEAELAAMLRHQLAAPLYLSLGVLSGEVAHQLRQTRPPLDPLLTLGQLLHHAHPAVLLLAMVKRFAKICRSDPDNPLPVEIVMLLYYASIGVAMMRTNGHISDLPPQELRRGLRWISGRSWVDEQTRGLLHEAIAHIDARVGASASSPGATAAK
jgi:hypothetical protein